MPLTLCHYAGALFSLSLEDSKILRPAPKFRHGLNIVLTMVHCPGLPVRHTSHYV